MKKLTQILEQVDITNSLLKKYPSFKKMKNGKYIGSDKIHNCERNSLKHKNEYDVYIGYIITYSPSYEKEMAISHIFNVKNNKVYEFTNLELNRYNLNWNDFIYIGKKVPEEYLKNVKDLLDFKWDFGMRVLGNG